LDIPLIIIILPCTQHHAHLDVDFRPMFPKSKTARKEHKCSFLAVSAFTHA